MSDSQPQEQSDAAGVPAAASVPDATAVPDRQMIQGRFAIVLVALMVCLGDVCLYHANGYSGPAVFLVGAMILLFAGIPNRSVSFTVALLAAMTVVLAARLAVNGFAFQVFAGFWLLFSVALALRKRPPFVLETLVFATQCIPGGYEFFSRLNARMRKRVLDPMDTGKPSRIVEIAFPLFAALLFGGIFVMANPDIVSWVSEGLSNILRSISRFVQQFSLTEIGFWIFIAWVTGGLLLPVVGPLLTGQEARDEAAGRTEESPLYCAFRNTLLTVIVLFGVYLIFESRAFLTRKPPEGFTYSSYAHEGAAWLTIALGLATLMLSLIFRGRMLSDPRLGRLHILAWLWSALNFLLALAVYNRMLIYIDFNGMTRMRTVALLGTTSVIGGFVLVLVRIHRQRDFRWLIRRQLWVLACAVYVYLALPVDALIHRYNVSRILSGNEAPIVQITEHEVDDEALPALLPLCLAEDERLRRGIRAMLSDRYSALRQRQLTAKQQGWTAWQKSTDDALAELEDHRHEWDHFEDPKDRNAAWTRLKDHAFESWW